MHPASAACARQCSSSAAAAPAPSMHLAGSRLPGWPRRAGGRRGHEPQSARSRTTARTLGAVAPGATHGPGGSSASSSSRRQRRAATAATRQQQQLDSDGPPDIWQPPPPAPGLGRKRRVALLVATAMLEVTMTGALIWSPLLGAVLLAVLQPTKAELQQQQEAAVQQAVAAAELAAQRHMPVTPLEPAAWLNRLNQEMWSDFWQPFLLQNNLSTWQDTVSAAAPRGWEVEIADVSIGDTAPQLSGFQALADPATGALTAVDADMAFDSESVRIVVVGKGPLGAFTAKVSAVHMQGHMRIIPLLQHRMLLAAFKQQPAVRVSLSLSAPLFKTALSPGDLGQLNFIQGLIASAVKEQLVEPRRMAISLDSDIRVEQAVATTLHLTIDSVRGLPARALPAATAGSNTGAGASGGGTSGADAAAVGGSGGTAAAAAAARLRRIVFVAVDTTSQVRRATAAVASSSGGSLVMRQSLSLALPRKQGLYRLEVRELAASSSAAGGRSSIRGSQLLGSGLLWVAAARDGTTLFWTHNRSGAPLATRWSPAAAQPWRLVLPLNPAVPAAQGLEVCLGVAAEPWVCRASLSAEPGVGPAIGARRSSGPRVVIVQVVEARGLVGSGSFSDQQRAGAPTTRVQLTYDTDSFSTATHFSSSSPIFGETFALQENPSLLTRRVKLEVWQDAAAGGSSGASASPQQRPGGGSSGRQVPQPSAQRPPAAGDDDDSSSSRILSHSLSDVSPDLNPPEPDSHMLIDVELEEAAAEEAPTAAAEQQQEEDAAAAADSGSVSLGSAAINIDQLSEGVIQDRWFPLSGVQGAGQVRLRLAVVPGALAAAARRGSSSSSSKRAGSSGSSSSAEVASLLSFFHRSLQGSSRDSVMVEVVSARLFLPLSSMDSSDLDQPAYVLSYGGSSTVTLPPYALPHQQQRQQAPAAARKAGQRQRPPSRSAAAGRRSPRATGGSGGSAASSSTRPSSGASRGGPASDGGEDDSSSSRRAASPSASVWDAIAPGNVSLQVGQHESSLARATFPLLPEGMQQRQQQQQQASAAAGAGAAPLLKVLLFDPDDLTHATPAAAAGAIAAAAAASRRRLTQPAAATSSSGGGPGSFPGSAMQAAAGSGLNGSSGGGPAGSSSSADSELSDIGGAEVDVLRLLGAVAAGGQAGMAAAAAAVAVGPGPGNAPVSAAAASRSWEGWTKLDRDGGHVLLRITQLPASQPADLVPPPGVLSTTSSGTGGGGDGSDDPGTDTSEGSSSGSGTAEGPSGTGLLPEDDLPALLAAVYKTGSAQLNEQVAGAVTQLSDVAAVAGSWLNSSSSSIGSWVSSSLPGWTTPRSSSSGNGKKKAPLPATDAGTKAPPQPAGRKPAVVSAKRAAQQQPDARGAAANGAAGSETQQQQQGGSQPDKQQAASWFDLRGVTKAFGWAPSPSKQPSAAPQDQQQQQPSSSSSNGAASTAADSSTAGVPSHPLPTHSLGGDEPEEAVSGSGAGQVVSQEAAVQHAAQLVAQVSAMNAAASGSSSRPGSAAGDKPDSSGRSGGGDVRVTQQQEQVQSHPLDVEKG